MYPYYQEDLYVAIKGYKKEMKIELIRADNSDRPKLKLRTSNSNQ